jgi:hypothetical protein
MSIHLRWYGKCVVHREDVTCVMEVMMDFLNPTSYRISQ